MWKVIGSAITALFLVLVAGPRNEKFSKFKAVETYEIRPGILMMPRYALDGQVCEIGLERRHYSPGKIYLSSTLSSKDIDQIVDELAPANERGPMVKEDGGLEDLILESGTQLTTMVSYENISVKTYSNVSPSSNKRKIVADDIAATITWKNRKCN